MNKANLQRMVDHLCTISDNQFDMRGYRLNGDKASPECNSVGCVIGHCTVLDSENVKQNYLNSDTGIIKFTDWSYDFTGLHGYLWDFCFGGAWVDTDNTIEGAIKRIESVINGEV